ncbi:YncE family protein [Aneurinibacillus terranovensis]|uniref:YncE family protein n=1 Tax=Aneurinibacillus terranovensis TaxID=278991 RepID=UPI00041435C8|nr:YncE family protein [Aneurinibacillus terranovensis]
MKVVQKLSLIIILFALTACGQQTFPKIANHSVVIVANVSENSISFIDTTTHKEINRWKPTAPFQRMLLLPNRNTLLLYSKDEENALLVNLVTGRQTGTWNIGKGVTNAVIAADQKHVYFADKATDSVRVWTLDGKETTEYKAGSSPFTLIPSLDGRSVYVFNLNGANVMKIDTENGRISGTYRTNESPMGGVLLEKRKELWIGGHGRGEAPEPYISVFSTETGKKLRSIRAPLMPIEFVPYDKKTVFVLSHGSGMLRRIDTASGQITGELTIGANPFGLVMDDDVLYVSSYDSGQVHMVDLHSLKIIKTITVGSGPTQMIVREGDSS